MKNNILMICSWLDLKKKLGKKGENFPELHRVVMNFKSWLRGVYHQVIHLQAYINEYTYRFNRSFMKGNIFDNLLERMMKKTTDAL